MKKRANRGGRWLAAALSVAIACQVLAQGPADMPKVPILEGTTYAVLKLDLTKVDGAAMVKWIVDTTDKVITDPAEKQQTLPALQRNLQQLVDAQQTMLKSGAPVVYFAFNEFPPTGPLIYAPLAKGGDPEAVRALMFSGPNGKQKGPDVAKASPMQNITVAMPDGVFMGKAEDYQRISQPHVGAPYLLFAMSQAPAAPVQIVAAPTEGLGLMLETMSPQVPPPVDLPMTTFTHGISSAVLTMQSPPNAAVHVGIQASAAAAAMQLKAVADKMLAMLNSPQLQKQAPPGIDLKAMVEALSPKVQENQLAIDLSGEQSGNIVLAMLLPQVARARQNATMVQSASNMHQIILATMNYASQNKGKLPDSLDQIKSLIGPAGVQVLTNPRAVNKEPGYIYVRWADSMTQIPKTNVLIYENPAALPPGTNTINAAYPDGSVRMQPTTTVLSNVKTAPPPGR